MKTLILLLSFIALGACEKVSYNNYKVFKVVPENEEQIQYLSELREKGYDVWTDQVEIGTDVRVMVAPAAEEDFIKNSESTGLKPEVKIADVQKMIDEQMIPASSVSAQRNLGSYSWDRYHSFEEILAWFDELAELYPDVVTVVEIGSTNEGRPLRGVKIDFNPNNRGSSPLIGMIEGGIHAREWIAPATVTWIIKEFLTSTDPNVRFLAETFVWHIFPVVNPDGYEYSFTNNRMWRKNRNSDHFSTCGANDDLSNGIDLNRNFDFVWMTTGASDNPCSETFAGPIASSEAETRAIINYVYQLKAEGTLLYYFAFHSYSQMILVPYSHVTGQNLLTVGNYGDLYEIAIRGASKLSERYGTQYIVGASSEILYPVSGGSFDWVKGVADIPIVYLFELRDLGEYGFLLPTDQIIPNNEEIVDCLVEMDRTTRQLGYYSSGATVLSSVAVMLSAVAVLVFAH